jgi:ankyrin repeat protein
MENERITKFRNLDSEKKKKVILHLIINNDNIGFIKDVLENIEELDPEIKNEAFLNAGTIEMIELFIKNNVNVNFKDFNGFTALMKAILNDKIDIVRFLVEECKAEVDIQNNNGQTPLMYAISKQNIEIVKLLVNKGADIYKNDINGNTPLKYAEETGNQELVEFLNKPYKCSFRGCDYKTKHTSNLKTHRRIHGKKPFSCTFEGCEYDTATNADLNKHKRTHTGDKPYKCDFEGCKYKSSNSSDLKRHERTQHKCDFEGCKYATTNASDFKKHKLSHTRNAISDERKNCEDETIIGTIINEDFDWLKNFEDETKRENATTEIDPIKANYVIPESDYDTTTSSSLKRKISDQEIQDHRKKIKISPSNNFKEEDFESVLEILLEKDFERETPSNNFKEEDFELLEKDFERETRSNNFKEEDSEEVLEILLEKEDSKSLLDWVLNGKLDWNS